MVVSRLEHTLSYPESRSVLPADKELDVDLYSIQVKDVDVVVAVGGAIHAYANKQIVHHPIYMITKKSKAIQIGVYEMRPSDVISLTDEDGGLSLEKLDEPLIYAFATKKMLLEQRMIPPPPEGEEEEDEKEGEEEVKLSSRSGSTTNAIHIGSIPALRADIFTLDTTIARTAAIPEETREAAQALVAEFVKPPKSQSSAWLQTVMKNNNYDTHENDGEGDCLFMVVRDAFLQLGQSTTVAKLRHKLSLEATSQLFDNYTTHYDMSSKTLMDETKRAKVLQTEYKKYEAKLKTTISALEQQELVSAAKHIAAQHKAAVAVAKAARELYNEFKFMKGVSTLDALQKKILTRDYWADTWAISTLERILGVKIVILSSEYAKKDENNLLQCGMNMDSVIESHGTFAPEFYILTEYTGAHYRLISYKGSRIFTYAEIPYDIKHLIVTKCMERNSGSFVMIGEFRKLAEMRLGKNTSDQSQNKSLLDEDIVDTIDVDVLGAADPNVVFRYYDRAADKPAGRGAGEKIEPIGRKLEFVELAPKGQFPNWRRKLDGTWFHPDTPIELDGRKWNSVQHYVQAGKFQKTNPELYNSFTAESGSDIAGDVHLAQKTSKLNTKDIDPTYAGQKKTAAMLAATTAKFTQIPHFNGLLRATKNAMIYQYISGAKPVVDTNLIMIRKSIGSLP